jgi:outer membrane receptor protein involved in Fe transport
MSKLGIQRSCVAAAMSIATLTGAANAQETKRTNAEVLPSGLEQIVVTAQKRAEPLRDVPMAITALTAEALVDSGVTNFRDYAVQVPNLSFAYSGNLSAQNQTIAIRGIYGSGTTGVYLDDTPLPGSVDPRVLDIERIEVLKGPQGTLYGARSQGGTVRLITMQPDPTEREGNAHAVGSFTSGGGGNGAIDGSLNLPLVADRAAVRINAYHEELSGVFDRGPAADAPAPFKVHEGVDQARFSGGSVSGIMKLLDDRLTILPRVMLARMRTDGRAQADVTADNFSQLRWFDLPEQGSDEYELYSLTSKLAFDFGEFTANTAYFDRLSSDQEDSSEAVPAILGTPPRSALFKVRSTDRNFSQELRFTSDFSSPLQFTAGVFYQDGRSHQVAPPTSIGEFIDNVYSADNRAEVKEVAVFGEATFDVTDQWSVIAGARWYDNEVDLDSRIDGLATGTGVFTGVQKQDGVNPKFGVRYHINPDATAYVTAAKGFRIGGINAYSPGLCTDDLAQLGLTNAEAQTYNSDTVWSYEVGAKTSWLNRRLTLNSALFTIDWSDVQQTTSLNCGFQIAVNGGRARSRGGELEIAATVTPDLKLSAGAGYTDARITEAGQFNIIPVDSRIQQVPQWTFNGTIDYNYDVASVPMFSRAEVAYVGSSFSTNNSISDPRRRDAYTLVKLRSGAKLGAVELTLFADNLFNEHANLSDAQPTGVEVPGRPRIVVNRPRTIGLDARVSFR